MYRSHTSTGHTRQLTRPSSQARRACLASGNSPSSTCYSSAASSHACPSRALHLEAAAHRHATLHRHHSKPCVRAAASPTTSSGPPTDRQRSAHQQSSSLAALPAVGDVLELECSRLGTGGVGICLWGSSSWVVLVQRALPGELLRCRVTSVSKGELTSKHLPCECGVRAVWSHGRSSPRRINH
jgi:hypothetical protein